MKNEKTENKTRRDFLKTGFAAVIAGTACFTMGGLKKALAAAKASDKPLLTVENLNAIIPDKPNDEYFKLGKEALRDPLAFLDKHFYISPEQQKGFSTVSDDDWAKVRKGIQITLEKKLDFSVRSYGKLIGANSNDQVKYVNAGYSRLMKMEFGFEMSGKSNGRDTEFAGKATVTVTKP